MEIGGDDQADDDGDDADELDAVIGGEAVGKVVGDGLIKVSDGGASSDESEAAEEPADAKIPVHKYYYTLDFLKKIG